MATTDRRFGSRGRGLRPDKNASRREEAAQRQLEWNKLTDEEKAASKAARGLPWPDRKSRPIDPDHWWG